MKKSMRNAAIGGVLAVSVIGAGTVAFASSPSDTRQTASSNSDQRSGGSRHGNNAEFAAALAKELGLTTDQVTAAQKATRDTLDKGTRPTTPPTDAQRKSHFALMQKTFAEKLGVSVDKLQAAELTVAKAHVAADVKAGKLTQAQADKMLAAIANGEMPPMGRGGPGGQGGPGRGGNNTERDAALAKELGLTTAQVTAAHKAAHDTLDNGTRPMTPPTDAQRKANFASQQKAFAERLGVSSQKLQAAELAVAKAHIAADVKSGKLTQAQADKMLAAIANGDMAPMGRGGPGGHGPRPGASASASAASNA